jgi:hypothetical protein
MTDPRKLLYRAPVSRTLTPALLAIGVAWALTLLLHLIILIREFLWMINDGPDYLGRAFGNFGDQAILEPLLFFLGAGALLLLVLPILPETPLPLVLLRAAAASLGGLVVLSVKGLIEAVVDSVQFGFEFGYFVNTWIGWPLVKTFDQGTLLVIGAVVAWILVNRRAARQPAEAAAPAVPPSDAG